MSQQVLKTILIIITIAVFSFVFSTLPKSDWLKIYNKYFPCEYPIVYNLGSLDSSFDISEESFLETIKEAESMWEDPFSLNLFEYQTNMTNGINDNLVINLIYDYRQEATEKIHDLGITLNNTRASYDALKIKYTILQENYLKDKQAYKTRVILFEERQENYNQEVQDWNQKGGAPKNVYESLRREEDALKIELTNIRKVENNINQQVADINALVSVINKLAETLNINAGKLGTIGKERGEEFTQGEYIVDETGERINIYEFSTKEKLKRVLAHEFGHALGLGHVEDEEAVMYRLNEGTSKTLSSDDLNALKTYCQVE